MSSQHVVATSTYLGDVDESAWLSDSSDASLWSPQQQSFANRNNNSGSLDVFNPELRLRANPTASPHSPHTPRTLSALPGGSTAAACRRLSAKSGDLRLATTSSDTDATTTRPTTQASKTTTQPPSTAAPSTPTAPSTRGRRSSIVGLTITAPKSSGPAAVQITSAPTSTESQFPPPTSTTTATTSTTTTSSSGLKPFLGFVKVCTPKRGSYYGDDGESSYSYSDNDEYTHRPTLTTSTAWAVDDGDESSSGTGDFGCDSGFASGVDSAPMLAISLPLTSAEFAALTGTYAWGNTDVWSPEASSPPAHHAAAPFEPPVYFPGHEPGALSSPEVDGREFATATAAAGGKHYAAGAPAQDACSVCGSVGASSATSTTVASPGRVALGFAGRADASNESLGSSRGSSLGSGLGSASHSNTQDRSRPVLFNSSCCSHSNNSNSQSHSHTQSHSNYPSMGSGVRHYSGYSGLSTLSSLPTSHEQRGRRDNGVDSSNFNASSSSTATGHASKPAYFRESSGGSLISSLVCDMSADDAACAPPESPKLMLPPVPSTASSTGATEAAASTTTALAPSVVALLADYSSVRHHAVAHSSSDGRVGVRTSTTTGTTSSSTRTTSASREKAEVGGSTANSQRSSHKRGSKRTAEAVQSGLGCVPRPGTRARARKFSLTSECLVQLPNSTQPTSRVSGKSGVSSQSRGRRSRRQSMCASDAAHLDGSRSEMFEDDLLF